ncbi:MULTISPECIES: hypothetical protein [Actinomycetes]|uniref:GP88 family protein n=1 Tax=Streptomyces sp. AA4 TaxID=591158 RepID=UPI00131A25FD|nr:MULTISPECIES: hypothetical protein [Actinomycetes]
MSRQIEPIQQFGRRNPVSDEPGRAQRPARLLTQNSQLKEIGVWNWTIPAWAGRFDDGTTYNTCPSAGICSKVCYARSGAYLWPQVRGKHQANLRFVLDDPDGFEDAMIAELGARRFHGKWIRVHDAGDFFSDDYTLRWMRIMRARPDSHFYAYTKELDRFRRLVAPDPPPNFLWTFSLGGTQDADLDPKTDRMADVFPSEEAIAAAGWHSQLGDDRLAVLGEAPVGMSANRIPKFLKLLDGRRFSEWQAQENERRAAKKNRAPGTE